MSVELHPVSDSQNKIDHEQFYINKNAIEKIIDFFDSIDPQHFSSDYQSMLVAKHQFKNLLFKNEFYKLLEILHACSNCMQNPVDIFLNHDNALENLSEESFQRLFISAVVKGCDTIVESIMSNSNLFKKVSDRCLLKALMETQSDGIIEFVVRCLFVYRQAPENDRLRSFLQTVIDDNCPQIFRMLFENDEIAQVFSYEIFIKSILNYSIGFARKGIVHEVLFNPMLNKILGIDELLYSFDKAQHTKDITILKEFILSPDIFIQLLQKKPNEVVEGKCRKILLDNIDEIIKKFPKIIIQELFDFSIKKEDHELIKILLNNEMIFTKLLFDAFNDWFILKVDQKNQMIVESFLKDFLAVLSKYEGEKFAASIATLILSENDTIIANLFSHPTISHKLPVSIIDPFIMQLIEGSHNSLLFLCIEHVFPFLELSPDMKVEFFCQLIEKGNQTVLQKMVSSVDIFKSMTQQNLDKILVKAISKNNLLILRTICVDEKLYHMISESVLITIYHAVMKKENHEVLQAVLQLADLFNAFSGEGLAKIVMEAKGKNNTEILKRILSDYTLCKKIPEGIVLIVLSKLIEEENNEILNSFSNIFSLMKEFKKETISLLLSCANNNYNKILLSDFFIKHSSLCAKIPEDLLCNVLVHVIEKNDHPLIKEFLNNPDNLLFLSDRILPKLFASALEKPCVLQEFIHSKLKGSKFLILLKIALENHPNIVSSILNDEMMLKAFSSSELLQVLCLVNGDKYQELFKNIKSFIVDQKKYDIIFQNSMGETMVSFFSIFERKIIIDHTEHHEDKMQLFSLLPSSELKNYFLERNSLYKLFFATDPNFVINPSHIKKGAIILEDLHLDITEWNKLITNDEKFPEMIDCIVKRKYIKGFPNNITRPQEFEEARKTIEIILQHILFVYKKSDSETKKTIETLLIDAAHLCGTRWRVQLDQTLGSIKENTVLERPLDQLLKKLRKDTLDQVLKEDIKANPPELYQNENLDDYILNVHYLNGANLLKAELGIDTYGGMSEEPYLPGRFSEKNRKKLIEQFFNKYTPVRILDCVMKEINTNKEFKDEVRDYIEVHANVPKNFSYQRLTLEQKNYATVHLFVDPKDNSFDSLKDMYRATFFDKEKKFIFRLESVLQMLISENFISEKEPMLLREKARPVQEMKEDIPLPFWGGNI